MNESERYYDYYYDVTSISYDKVSTGDSSNINNNNINITVKPRISLSLKKWNNKT